MQAEFELETFLAMARVPSGSEASKKLGTLRFDSSATMLSPGVMFENLENTRSF